MERSARERVRDLHAWRPNGLIPRRRTMAGLCAHLHPAGRTPTAGPPTAGVMWRPRERCVPARPRRHAVDGRWPCTPIPGRWMYQRTAPPTGFPATLTWRRWRRTLPDIPPYHPPSSAGPPDWKLCGDDNALRNIAARLLGELFELAAPPRAAPRKDRRSGTPPPRPAYSYG